MKKILIIEDDENICIELKELLDNAGYEAVILKDFQNAMKEIIAIDPDLILLDINLPYINGDALLMQFRKEKDTPVIMVTSRDSELDEVLSMSYGADDYITKPYHPTVLLLHINAVCKRMENNPTAISYEDAVFIPKKGSLKCREKEIVLTKNESLIFGYLLQNRGEIVSRDDLMTELWNNDEYVNDNTLTVNVSRLRNKLKELGFEDRLETRVKQGYLLL